MHAQIPKPSWAILGAGAWGSALALVAAHAGHGIMVWDHDAVHIDILKETRRNNKYLPGVHFPEHIYFTANLAEVVQHVQDICLVVPSHAVRPVVKQIASLNGAENLGIIIASKGLDPETGSFLDQSIQAVLGEDTVLGVLSGPSFAKEVAKGLPTALSFASHNPGLITRVNQQFGTNSFRIYHSDDLIGVQLGGVVKNVIAIAAGICDGLRLGANARSALITRGLAEMMRLGERVGARAATLSGLSGVGDLILTCTDDQSRNRQFGLKIGQGNTPEEANQALEKLVEGWHNVKILRDLSARLNVATPITEEVYKILWEGKSPQSSLQDLMMRDFKAEHN